IRTRATPSTKRCRPIAPAGKTLRNAIEGPKRPPARDGERQMGAILVGTSSWNDHEPFYPPGTEPSERLGIYARYFPVVEVNTTYYRIPRRSMVERWVDRTPPGFVFDVKPPRALTST